MKTIQLLKNIWEISSLSCGMGAIGVIIFKFLETNCIYEPSPVIKTIEIVWGCSAIVYLFKRLSEKIGYSLSNSF